MHAVIPDGFDGTAELGAMRGPAIRFSAIEFIFHQLSVARQHEIDGEAQPARRTQVAED